MIAAVDAGNSRIKWGLHDGSTWLDQGVLATADAVWLKDIAEDWPSAARVAVCNVAGAAVHETIVSALKGRQTAPAWLRASAAACGVHNNYEQAGQLGSDRWAALIGARGQTSAACLVVCAGTATTVDVLDACGEFRGGIIMPGFDLMRTALARSTAQLPLAEGQFRDEPRNTMDAIVSGCLHAQAGAIERLFASLAGEANALCLLTGGAAPRIGPHLNIPLRRVDNLVLDGLVRFGASL